MHPNMPEIFREYMSLERRRASADGVTVAEYQRWVDLKRLLNRHFQPDIRDVHEDRRKSVRVPSKLRLAFETYGELRECLMSNLSRGGLFIVTTDPLPLGSVLKIWISIAESGQEIEVEGEVASHNSGPGLLSEELGMGIRFIRLSEEQEKAIDNLYEHSLRVAIEPL